MKVGALLFAFNNDDIDYVEMAAWSAHHIKRHLQIPVAVVTNDPQAQQYSIFDHVIQTDLHWDGNQRFFQDLDKSVPWYNANRVDSYNLSPWDRTIVLDTDFVINSQNLLPAINSNNDFMCYRWSTDATTGETSNWDLNYFGRSRFPMWWATVMIFNKSTVAKYVFDSMHMVRQNWQHYRNLYGIQQTQYRNDYALSMSLGLVSGHTMSTTDIFGSLITLTPGVKLSKLDTDCYEIQWYDKLSRPRGNLLSGIDFHAMCKSHLGDVIAKDRKQGLFNTSV